MKRVAVVVALALFVAFSARLKLRLLAESGTSGPLTMGAEAPPLVLETPDGETVDLEELKGEKKVVLVNFWATWCSPCRIEMPQLARLHEEHGDEGLAILAVTQEDRADVEEFLRANPFPFPILLDTGGTVTKAYGVKALPTTVIVDKRGRVLQSREGVSPFLEGFVTTFLEQPEAADSGNGGGDG